MTNRDFKYSQVPELQLHWNLRISPMHQTTIISLRPFFVRVRNIAIPASIDSQLNNEQNIYRKGSKQNFEPFSIQTALNNNIYGTAIYFLTGILSIRSW